MNRTYFLSKSDLAALTGELLGSRTRVVGPGAVANRPAAREYRVIDHPETLQLGGPLPRMSLKAMFLPPSEPLLRWRQKKGEVEMTAVPTTFAPTVILGAHPCDAAAVATVDRVMDWDYHDELWFGRRQATTIVSLACDGGDRHCFCTAVGLAPDTAKGSDLMLVPLEDGYHVDVLTPKGEAFVAAHMPRFAAPKGVEQAAAFRRAAQERVAGQCFGDFSVIGKYLAEHFDDPRWVQMAVGCHGCGACAAVCPTCHCFDIVDEPEGLDHGTRRRNWDTCQTALFTLHGSGHNPRTDQVNRTRQRLLHKMHIYPSRFGEMLCMGCGRCSRACPGSASLLERLNGMYRMICGTQTPAGGVA